MGFLKPSLRSTAARFVSNVTTTILSPISEPSTPAKKDENGMNCENTATESDSKPPDGPDTSSFPAFLASFLASSEPDSHSDDSDEYDRADATEEVPSSSAEKESGGKKSLISRGKQSVSKLLQKATRWGAPIYDRSEQKHDGSTPIDSGPVEHEMKPLNVTVEASLHSQLPEISEQSLLLSQRLHGALYVSLPLQAKGKKWVLLYSTGRHGISLSTLYRRSRICPGHTLLIVGDQKGAVFGGLVEAPLQPIRNKYQWTNGTSSLDPVIRDLYSDTSKGTKSCFVFTNLLDPPVIFHPTGANPYYTLCSTDSLALGGGSHFALCLHEDLLTGSSNTSETFGNSCLAHTEFFDVKEVELWGFVYASKYEEILESCRTEAPGISRW